MRPLLLASFVVTAILHADTALPSLIWTGSTTGGGTDTLDGVEISGVCTPESEKSCGAEGLAERTFTVTSPGLFVLSTLAELSFSSASYDIGQGFSPAAELFAEFEDQAFDGFLLGSSGSSIVPCGPSNILPSGFCLVETSLNLSTGWVSEQLYLDSGDYTFQQGFAFDAAGSGLVDGTGTFDGNLVPTPEPRGGIAVLAGAFLVLLWWPGRDRTPGPRC